MLDNPVEFDPEVRFIEDQILNYLINWPVFRSKDPAFIKILGLFITRKFLTQKFIRQVTGLSAGKISQEINKMVDIGLIKVADVSPKGKITYVSTSAGLTFLKYTKNIIEHLGKWENDLKIIKNEMETKKKQLEHLEGYQGFYKLVSSFSPVIKIYMELLIEIQKDINDMEK